MFICVRGMGWTLACGEPKTTGERNQQHTPQKWKSGVFVREGDGRLRDFSLTRVLNREGRCTRKGGNRVVGCGVEAGKL